MYQDLFSKNKQGLYISATDNEFQSTFLPIFSNAETQIKKIIVKYFWQFKSKRELLDIIKKYIYTIDKKVPKELPNRDAYIQGLWKKSQKMVEEYYTKALVGFSVVLALLIKNQTRIGVKMPKITTPQEFVEYTQNTKINYRMWEQAKASVRVQNYPQELQKYINNITGEVITTYEKGTKGISLWQKAELDVRYGHQMEMLQEARDSGNDLFWLSSHPDCSKRCEKWQGKLVSVSKHSVMSGFRVGKVDGNWVYSLTDIMDQKDKYGYHNNIINGFNCRHYLIKYESGKLPPKHFEEHDVKKMRAINNRIREYEREIRFAKTQEKLYNSINDTKNAKKCRIRANNLTKAYYEYCKKNGFASMKYRIEI